ncbi:MAG: peptidoglycan DD-metalloendopeptidase family protein [Propionibacteriaceae bacterium]|jgi:murein DD-endopeptidase MepM/ murein hydrolase activator NlpD|nr:peptidoglycan DD-metalloendopeptidase family protein [Propionibacteriaceae bacterium]
MKRLLILSLAVACVLPLSISPAWSLSGVLPLAGPMVRGFDPPDQRWLAGHRGVDILGHPGDEIVAAAAGKVSYAGNVGGKPVVTVTHGELRTTYEPVRAAVKVGQQVYAGELIGTLEAGHDCPGGDCLHWGLKRGEEYLDPLSLLDGGQVRLLPDDALELVKVSVKAREAALGAGGGIPGFFSMPTNGTLGSPFGMRMHPIFHEMRLHEGQDISASCGTAITAAADGVVQSVSYDDSGGHRLVLDHGIVGGRRLRSHYLHAQGYTVKAGQHVIRGQKLGTVGSTGWSTGCHLHFSVSLDGKYVDPKGFW